MDTLRIINFPIERDDSEYTMPWRCHNCSNEVFLAIKKGIKWEKANGKDVCPYCGCNAICED